MESVDCKLSVEASLLYLYKHTSLVVKRSVQDIVSLTMVSGQVNFIACNPRNLNHRRETRLMKIWKF